VVEYFKLDKIVKVGEEIQLPQDRFYVIRKVGTDAASAACLVIDGVETGLFVSDIAPLHKTTSNLLGPFDLKDLYYVVPPGKKFWVKGPSGAKVRIIGEIGRVAPGEPMPATFASRFENQGKVFRTYVTGSATLAPAGGTWAADAETEVLVLTPRTIEKYLFNDVVMASLTGYATAPAEGDVAVRFFLEGVPFDILTKEAGRLGIDLFSIPKPPAGTTEMEAFTLADRPIEVLGDRTFSVRFVNTSGAGIGTATGVDLVAAVWLICTYSKG